MPADAPAVCAYFRAQPIDPTAVAACWIPFCAPSFPRRECDAECTWITPGSHSRPVGGWTRTPGALGGGREPERPAAPAPSRRHRRRPDAERSPGGAAGTEEDGTRPVRHLHPEQGGAFLGGPGRPAGARRHDRVRLLSGPPRRDEAGDDLRGDLQGRRGRQAEGHGAAAKAAGEPLQPRAQARPEGQDVARQAPRGRADRPAAAGDGLGDAGRHEPGGDPPQGRLPVQGAASPGAGRRAGRPGLSPDADQDVPPPGALRRRVRPARSLPARVPAGDVPPEPTRAGRRLPRRGRLDQQLLPPVQGHPDAGAARRPAPAGDAVPAGGVQPDRRPQDAPSPAWE